MAGAEPCRSTSAISKVSLFEDSIERLQHAFDELRRDRYLGIGEMGKLKHSDTMRENVTAVESQLDEAKHTIEEDLGDFRKEASSLRKARDEPSFSTIRDFSSVVEATEGSLKKIREELKMSRSQDDQASVLFARMQEMHAEMVQRLEANERQVTNLLVRVGSLEGDVTGLSGESRGHQRATGHGHVRERTPCAEAPRCDAPMKREAHDMAADIVSPLSHHEAERFAKELTLEREKLWRAGRPDSTNLREKAATSVVSVDVLRGVFGDIAAELRDEIRAGLRPDAEAQPCGRECFTPRKSASSSSLVPSRTLRRMSSCPTPVSPPPAGAQPQLLDQSDWALTPVRVAPVPAKMDSSRRNGRPANTSNRNSPSPPRAAVETFGPALRRGSTGRDLASIFGTPGSISLPARSARMAPSVRSATSGSTSDAGSPLLSAFPLVTPRQAVPADVRRSGVVAALPSRPVLHRLSERRSKSVGSVGRG